MRTCRGVAEHERETKKLEEPDAVWWQNMGTRQPSGAVRQPFQPCPTAPPCLLHGPDPALARTGRARATQSIAGLISVLILGLVSAPRAQPTAGAAGTEPRSISGRVTDRSGQPISQVSVRIAEPPRQGTTGEDGRYVLEQLPAATYRVSFSRIGFQPAERAVVVRDRGVLLDVVLDEAPLELAPITVASPSQPSRLLSVAQPIEVLADSDVHLADAPNLGRAVESAAGVRNMGTGNGIGKPVIRGLRSDRVLVASDGFRLETQQWEDDEGPTVPTADADRIEVIRGPASVIYGSDALGGIINVVPRVLPSARDRSPFIAGQLNGSFASNGDAGEGRMSLEGARQSLGCRGTFQFRDQGNLVTPEGELLNSGLRSLTGTGAVGAQGDQPGPGAGGCDAVVTERRRSRAPGTRAGDASPAARRGARGGTQPTARIRVS